MEFDRFFVTVVLCLLCPHHVPIFTASSCKIDTLAPSSGSGTVRYGVSSVNISIHDVASLVADVGRIKVSVAVASVAGNSPKLAFER